MPWVRVDDGFTDHPKVMAAGPAASWLYVCGLTYSARLLTDGFIPASQVRKLADLENAGALADTLVRVGLWQRCDGGFRIHDYHDYNPTAEKVKADRAAAAERMRKVRSGEVHANSERTNGERSDELRDPHPTPVVPTVNSPPDPPIVVEGADAPPKPKRPQQVPENWDPGADDRAWAEREGFSATEIERQLPMFRDHYRGQGKPMKDWAATWRNWMRRSRDDPRFAPRPRASPNGTGPPKRYNAYDILNTPTSDEGTLKW